MPPRKLLGVLAVACWAVPAELHMSFTLWMTCGSYHQQAHIGHNKPHWTLSQKHLHSGMLHHRNNVEFQILSEMSSLQASPPIGPFCCLEAHPNLCSCTIMLGLGIWPGIKMEPGHLMDWRQNTWLRTPCFVRTALWEPTENQKASISVFHCNPSECSTGRSS